MYHSIKKKINYVQIPSWCRCTFETSQPAHSFDVTSDKFNKQILQGRLRYRAIKSNIYISNSNKVKVFPLQARVVQRVGRGIALLFHDRGTRRGWKVSSTPRPDFTPGKDPVPIAQEAVWSPGPVWTGGKSRPHRDSIPDRPTHSQSLYRLSYPAHSVKVIHGYNYKSGH